jgi:N-acyl-D-amino-acid deacylase
MPIRRLPYVFATVILFVSLAPGAHSQDAPRADVLLKSAVIIDGSGQPGVIGDVAIKANRIIGVGKFELAGANQTIDCAGLIVCPGFIDLHNHSDSQIVQPDTRANMNFVLQGCTTIITGNCGSGPVDTAGYLAKVDQAGAGTNVGHLVPQGALREDVVGLEDRKATSEEIEKMRQLADKAMVDGCWGMSTGLIYVPSSYADTAEISEIAKVVGQRGGLYVSHIRGEGRELLASVEEVLKISRVGNLPGHISHFKCSGKDAWGLAERAIELVESARSRGVLVTADQYPYFASSTSLEATVIPTWARSGGNKKLLERWDDSQLGPTLKAEIEDEIRIKDDGRMVRFARYAPRPDWIGKNLFDVAEGEKKSTLEIVREVMEHGGASIVHFSMNEEEVRAIMKKPWVATASDGRADLPGVDKPHPRLYGTFPRKIGRYSMQERVIPLEQAIRSATGLPADIFGLADADRYAAPAEEKDDKSSRVVSASLARGYLKPGMAADVVVFDPKTFIDNATFDEPTKYSSGVKHMWVNGTAAIVDGHPTGALAGVALRHKAKLEELGTRN